MLRLVCVPCVPKRCFVNLSMNQFGDLHEQWMKNYRNGIIQEQSTNRKDYHISDHSYEPWNRIPESTLKDKHLYKIRARNSTVGMYQKEHRLFVIVRKKCGLTFLCQEYDFATGRPYGTAVPYEEMKLVPFLIQQNETLLLKLLDNCNRRIQ